MQHFCVVEFDQSGGGGVAIVNQVWLTPRKQEVFWPPYKDQEKYNKALKRAEPVDPEEWKLFKIARNFFQTDSYEKALKVLKKCQYTSDVNNSESEEVGGKKRKRSKPSRLDSDSDDDEGEVESKFSRPPPIRKISSNLSKRTSSQVQSVPSRQRVEAQTESPRLIENGNSAQNFNGHNNGHEIVLKQVLSPPIRTIESPHFSNKTVSHISELQSTPSSQRVQSQAESSCLTGDTDNIQNFHRDNNAYEILLKQILFVKQQNTQILNLLKGQKSTITIQDLPPDLPVKLPVEYDRDFEAFEIYLQDDENLNGLSAYLSSKGGRDLHSKTNNILKYLLSDRIASKFNFLGRNNKKAFSETRLKTVIIRAIKISCKDATEKDVEDGIKLWLKHAPKRLTTKSHN